MPLALRTLRLVTDSDTFDAQGPQAWLQAVSEQRSKAAFAQLFGHFAPRIKTYLTRLGSSAAEAEELAQDVMFSVWQRAPTFDAEKANVSTWIFTIARNRRVDSLRRQQWPLHGRQDIDALSAVLPDPQQQTEHDALVQIDGQRVNHWLACLPQTQEEVIRMAFMQEKTHQEIAEQLAVPLGTIKSRMRTALQRLQDAFAKA